MKIVVGSDHAGIELKQELISFLSAQGHTVEDHGAYSNASVDYPDIAEAVSLAVLSDQKSMGLLICGAGIGMSITANKFAGIRAALCHEPVSAALAREHNNANVLVLGARIIGTVMAQETASAFFSTKFSGGRHEIRLKKIELIEKRQ